MPTSLFVVDDHPLIRRGMRDLFSRETGFSIAGEASDGVEAVRLVERLKPDVVVLAVTLSGLSGLEALAIMRQRSPSTQVVMYAQHPDRSYLATALKRGALGYVLKECEEQELIRAVREAAAGRRFLCPTVADHAIDAYVEQLLAGPDDSRASLTDREREVLQMSAEGMSSSEVALRLHISHRTVENHRAHVLRKLGLRNQHELVLYAVRERLIPLNV